MPDYDSDQTVTIRGLVPPAATSEAGHYLAYEAGEETKRVRIGPGGISIGRAPPSELIIPSPDVSRRHCRIDLDGEWAVLADLGSTNGTFHGGERVATKTRLRNGSRLSLGSFPIRYERRDPAEVEREAALAADLRRAMDYVRAILPRPLSEGPLRAEWWFQPSSHLGGDVFGYQFLDDRTFAGFLLDVSGHGVGAALHAVNVANTIRRGGLPGVDFRDPAAVGAALNNMFPMEEHGGLMLTLWYFVYDLEKRRLRYCSAGHHAAYLRDPARPEPLALWKRAPAIGFLPVGRWEAGEIEVPAGSRLYVFSDGVFEIVAENNCAWTIEDLRAEIAFGGHYDLSEPQRLWDAVHGAAAQPLEDDFSVMVLTFDPESLLAAA